MNRITTTTARKPTHRAFEDWRTTCAARSGDSSTARVAGGEVKRSTGAVSTGGRGTGRRWPGSSSEPSSGGVVIEPAPSRATSDAAGRRAWRDQPGLTERDRKRTERDLARIDRQHSGAVDGDREPVHAARRGAERGAVGLDAEPVIARAVARTLEPEVLETRIRLAAQVRAALVQRADVECLSAAARVLAREEPLLSWVVQDHEGAGLRVVGREALLDGEAAVLELDRVDVADGDRCPETTLQVRPREGERARQDLEGPETDSGRERGPHQLAT